jgi:hypothetical protein
VRRARTKKAFLVYKMAIELDPEFAIAYALLGRRETLRRITLGRVTVKIRWDENGGLRRDAISSQVIDALEAQGDKGDRQ